MSKSTIEQSKLLNNIVSARLEKGLERSVLPMFKNYSECLAEKGGLEPSISCPDAGRYIKEVIDDIKR
jgi:hypothetical protein